MSIASKPGPAARVARHRRKAAREGAKRVEVVLPAADVDLVRHVAAMLKAGGTTAQALRVALNNIVPTPPARTGAGLVAFFRSSPLVGVDLDFSRDGSPGRDVDLG